MRVLILLSVLLTSACGNGLPVAPHGPRALAYDVSEMLRSDATGGFSRAYRQREFVFPLDHTAHPEFKHEWWYFTGNLVTNTGRKFGYQLTFFRVALVADQTLAPTKDFQPKLPDLDVLAPSHWRAQHYYMANFALTDVAAEKFYRAERFQRQALGLAGALMKGANPSAENEADVGTDGIKIWTEDWSAESVGSDVFPLRLVAQNDGVRFKLSLTQNKGVVLNGDQGLSKKGSKPGNASYYYSMPRLDTHGTIHVDGEEFKVSGDSWLDREWSTSALDEGLVGWDWFSIHLSNGDDIMFYQLRREDGSIDAMSSGTFIKADGKAEPLLLSEVLLESHEEWISPTTKIRYPAAWTLTLRSKSMELNIVPMLSDQEMNLTVNYWEGAVRITGRYLDGSNKLLDGQGYVELAGYLKSS